MARMDPDSRRAALIYQYGHAAPTAPSRTPSMPTSTASVRAMTVATNGQPGTLVPRVNATWAQNPAERSRPRLETSSLTWAFVWERVTRIELALSAWEVQRSRLVAALTCGCRCPLVAVVAPSSPWLMAANGPAIMHRAAATGSG
jgi:hypothetical protein